jgi:hypothetical protein
MPEGAGSLQISDDVSVPLICPTGQLAFGITEKTNTVSHMATVHGVVFDVLVLVPPNAPKRPTKSAKN